MSKTIAALLPATGELLVRFGGRLRLARLRRRLSAKQVAERAGMVPMTLRSVERGGAGVTMGAYLAVMQVLGVEKDLEQLVEADPLGRELQDARLPSRVAAASIRPRKAVSAGPPLARTRRVVRAVKRKKSPTRAPERGWMDKSDFASSAALARLIDPGASRSRKRR